MEVSSHASGSTGQWWYHRKPLHPCKNPGQPSAADAVQGSLRCCRTTFEWSFQRNCCHADPSGEPSPASTGVKDIISFVTTFSNIKLPRPIWTYCDGELQVFGVVSLSVVDFFYDKQTKALQLISHSAADARPLRSCRHFINTEQQ